MNSKLTSYFYKYTFLMSFPILMLLWQNLSMIYFALIFTRIKKRSIFFEPTHWIQIVLWVFGIGAIISVVDSNGLEEDINRGLIVLPNYLYWVVTGIFLVNICQFINYTAIAKYISIGMIVSIIFYYLESFFPEIPGFLNSFSPNGFAFLCICFTAPTAAYIHNKKGLLLALLLIVVVLFTLLIAERRAGFVLVFISSFISIFFKSIKLKYLTLGTIISVILFLVIQIEFVEEFMLSTSPRIHELIYENESITTEDRSLLTRKLMIEKSLIIFGDHPLTGIGLNNFGNYEVDFKGDFEGSEYVATKQGMNNKSAHNSYASLLGEGGLLLLVPVLIIILFNCYNFIVNFASRTQIQNAFYMAFLCSCAHMYFISALLNVYTWFLIGIVTAMSVNNKVNVLSRKI